MLHSGSINLISITAFAIFALLSRFSFFSSIALNHLFFSLIPVRFLRFRYDWLKQFFQYSDLLYHFYYWIDIWTIFYYIVFTVAAVAVVTAAAAVAITTRTAAMLYFILARIPWLLNSGSHSWTLASFHSSFLHSISFHLLPFFSFLFQRFFSTNGTACWSYNEMCNIIWLNKLKTFWRPWRAPSCASPRLRKNDGYHGSLIHIFSFYSRWWREQKRYS